MDDCTPLERRLESATVRINAYLAKHPTATMQDPVLAALWQDREFALELLEERLPAPEESD